MTNLKKLEFLLIRYAPSALADEALNIAVLGWTDEFVGVRFMRNWDRLLRLDPDADLELLEGIRKDIEVKMHSPDWREVLQRMEDSFSNTIQCSNRNHCLCVDAVKEVEDLASMYLAESKTLADVRL